MERKTLKESIIQTVTYFDLFDFPLTTSELHAWLYDNEASFMSLYEWLRNTKDKGVVCTQGLWHLPDREEIVKVRKRRYRYAEYKYVQAIKHIKKLSHCKDVLFIGVCNTLGYSNAEKDSDIDLFIICKPKRVWRARLYTVGLMSVLGKRPKKDRQRDTACLSFFR